MNIIPREQHCISRKHISDNALKVMSRLHAGDYQAYLVGGAVRDLLRGVPPKDFDVATDATPEQVAELFRNSRIIGRRFRIVHVRFGREIIEVTTFRGHHSAAGNHESSRRGGNRSRQSASGLLLRDNVYGTLAEDAVRRDLTVNALYYDAQTFELFDHVHGLPDLEARSIRIIGDPEKRFTEDPVRMLRVLRFAAKLDFTIEEHTAAGIPPCARLLLEIPPARLFDEFLKLFLSGFAATTFEQLLTFDLLRYLFPDTSAALREENALTLIRAAMENTDARIGNNKPVTPAFILAALLWPVAHQAFLRYGDRGDSPMVAMHAASMDTLAEANRHVSIPRRFAQPIREIWEFQLRLQRKSGRKAAELVDHRRFRAAYDFLLLREQAGEKTDGLGAFWTEVQTLSPQQRLASMSAGKGGGRRRSRTSRTRPVS
ncbi:MAG: polynucleotide adenylyltransferase PcnB [Halioglobus sp.]|nr:polynucleotide adenylyltransferase PcnB [Halioglobus sp.]